MHEPERITQLARDSSTEDLCNAIAMIPQKRAEIVKLIEQDRANPKYDEKMRANMLDVCNNFMRIYDSTAEILKAELKRRLH